MKIFITNLPAFYKVNLYAKIAEHKKIFVVYTGYDAQRRNSDFMSKSHQFDYADLSNKSFVFKLYYLLRLIIYSDYEELNVSGLNEYTTWFTLILSPKRKNSTSIESSHYESTTNGFKGFVKKILLKRVSKVYASGSSQVLLAQLLGYDGEIIVTKGVGLFNNIPQPKYESKESVRDFLYVGRLSEEKNLLYLIKTFQKYPQLNLNIIGFGPLEEKLKSEASANVKFYGAIPNRDLSFFYKMNDVFILPSVSEPWGLVIEEAFNNGLPVIVSDRVGCIDEIVRHGENGLIFALGDPESLSKSLNEIQNVELYNKMRYTISKMDFEMIAQEQVYCYLD